MNLKKKLIKKNMSEFWIVKCMTTDLIKADIEKRGGVYFKIHRLSVIRLFRGGITLQRNNN